MGGRGEGARSFVIWGGVMPLNSYGMLFGLAYSHNRSSEKQPLSSKARKDKELWQNTMAKLMEQDAQKVHRIVWVLIFGHY